MTVLEGLKATRKRIANPGNWTQGVMARDSQGERCDVSSEQAYCFCLAGAASASIRFQHDYLRVFDALNVFAIKAGSRHVADFNDSHTHEEVLALIDRAIAQEEAKG